LYSIYFILLLFYFSAPWPITNVEDLHRHIMNYCREVLSDSNYNIIFRNILRNLFLTSSSLQVSNFMHIFLYILKGKRCLLDKDQVVVYNKNHIRHFRKLSWWYKSNLLKEFKSCDLNSNDTLEPPRKKKKFDRSENDLKDSILNDAFAPLAKFCEDTRTQVMEVHLASKEVENRLRLQQLENALFEEKLKRALFD